MTVFTAFNENILCRILHLSFRDQQPPYYKLGHLLWQHGSYSEAHIDIHRHLLLQQVAVKNTEHKKFWWSLLAVLKTRITTMQRCLCLGFFFLLFSVAGDGAAQTHDMLSSTFPAVSLLTHIAWTQSVSFSAHLYKSDGCVEGHAGIDKNKVELLHPCWHLGIVYLASQSAEV